jgi:hypothetical protein
MGVAGKRLRLDFVAEFACWLPCRERGERGSKKHDHSEERKDPEPDAFGDPRAMTRLIAATDYAWFFSHGRVIALL